MLQQAAEEEKVAQATRLTGEELKKIYQDQKKVNEEINKRASGIRSGGTTPFQSYDSLRQSIASVLGIQEQQVKMADAEKDSYNTIKKQGIFEKLVEDEGSYKSLVEKLWFHLNNNPKKITDDYHVFIPMIGQFKGKYVDRINLSIEEKIHQVQISIYPIDESCKKYIFILESLRILNSSFPDSLLS
jgi:hypothetical protein